MSNVVPKKVYDKLFDKFELELEKRIRAENKLAYLQKKYNDLKYPKVVRSQIEEFERLWARSFVEDETLTANLHGIPKSKEIRRQMWLHILLSSSNADVTFLRKLILFNNLDQEKYFADFKGHQYKSVKNKTGYLRNVELNKLMEQHLRRIENDVFITALLQYLQNPLIRPGNVQFDSWCRNTFKDFATTIAEIYSHISDKIHNARFDMSEQLPAEYWILKQPKLDQCINYIMSFYS